MKDLISVLEGHLQSLLEYQLQGFDIELVPIIEALKRTISILKRIDEEKFMDIMEAHCEKYNGSILSIQTNQVATRLCEYLEGK